MLFLALTIAAAHTDAVGHLIECSKVEPTQPELRCTVAAAAAVDCAARWLQIMSVERAALRCAARPKFRRMRNRLHAMRQY